MATNDRPTNAPATPRTTDRPGAFGLPVPRPRNYRAKRPVPPPPPKRRTLSDCDPGPWAYLLAVAGPLLLAALGVANLLSVVR